MGLGISAGVLGWANRDEGARGSAPFLLPLSLHRDPSAGVDRRKCASRSGSKVCCVVFLLPVHNISVPSISGL